MKGPGFDELEMGLGKVKYGIIFDRNMSGEMYMQRRNEVFGYIPHARGALT